MSLIHMTPEEAVIQRARISICESCPIFSSIQRRCIRSRGGCGCFMDMKTRIMGAACPQGEWPDMSGQEVIAIAHTASLETE